MNNTQSSGAKEVGASAHENGTGVRERPVQAQTATAELLLHVHMNTEF